MEIESWVNQSAASVARAYASWTSFPDVRQHLWTWAYHNQERITEYLARPDGERIVRSVLNQEARNYALKERAVMTGYSPDDLAWYTPTEIRKTLPDVFDYEDWQSFEVRGEGRGSKPVNATGDRLATILDVKKGLERLHPDQVALLREHYGRGVSAEACAEALGIHLETCRKRILRAVNALSKALNTPRQLDPYEGVTYEEWSKHRAFYDTRTKGRKAMSNAAARKRTEGYYE